MARWFQCFAILKALLVCLQFQKDTFTARAHVPIPVCISFGIRSPRAISIKRVAICMPILVGIWCLENLK